MRYTRAVYVYMHRRPEEIAVETCRRGNSTRGLPSVTNDRLDFSGIEPRYVKHERADDNDRDRGDKVDWAHGKKIVPCILGAAKRPRIKMPRKFMRGGEQ